MALREQFLDLVVAQEVQAVEGRRAEPPFHPAFGDVVGDGHTATDDVEAVAREEEVAGIQHHPTAGVVLLQGVGGSRLLVPHRLVEQAEQPVVRVGDDAV